MAATLRDATGQSATLRSLIANTGGIVFITNGCTCDQELAAQVNAFARKRGSGCVVVLPEHVLFTPGWLSPVGRSRVFQGPATQLQSGLGIRQLPAIAIWSTPAGPPELHQSATEIRAYLETAKEQTSHATAGHP